jgi:hypothetical protein
VGAWLLILRVLRSRESETFVGASAASHRLYQHAFLLFAAGLLAIGLSDLVPGPPPGGSFAYVFLLLATPLAALLACGPSFLYWSVATYIFRPAYALRRERILQMTEPRVIAAYSVLTLALAWVTR